MNVRLRDSGSDGCRHVCSCRWGDIEFPLPFGRTMSLAEHHIHSLDEKVGGPFSLNGKCASDLSNAIL